MPTIIARIQKMAHESVMEFKQRVGREYLELCDEYYAKHPERTDWVLSRMTKKDGSLINDFSWGSAFPELPDETCFIAWLNPSEKRMAKISNPTTDDLNAYLSAKLNVANALMQYPHEKELPIHPDVVPDEWKNYPIIKAAKKWSRMHG